MILLKIRNSFIIRRSSDVLNRTIIDKILHNKVPKGGLLYPMIISCYCFGYRLDSFDVMNRKNIICVIHMQLVNILNQKSGITVEAPLWCFQVSELGCCRDLLQEH